MDIEKALTCREFEVFKLVVTGRKNQEIADALQLSRRTVEFHRANIRVKLDAANIVELIRMAVVAGY